MWFVTGKMVLRQKVPGQPPMECQPHYQIMALQVMKINMAYYIVTCLEKVITWWKDAEPQNIAGVRVYLPVHVHSPAA
jgi:hypothetical protein